MAKTGKASIKQTRFQPFHRLAALLSILCFIVMLVGGLMAEVRMITIAYRAVVVVFAISLVTKILIRAWISWEEMNRGQS